MRQRAWRRLLIFLCFFAQTHSEDVFGILGEDFTFPVKIDEKITEIIWTKNKNKVAEWEDPGGTKYFNSLLDRGFLNKENGRLTIMNLESSDAGTYVLDFFSSGNSMKTFVLTVLDPPSEPKISCNISDGYFVLKCTADFPKTLNYTWKFSSFQNASQTQETSIPAEAVGASERATCFVRFSETEKNSEISLDECYSDEKGDDFHKRSRGGLIGACVVFIVIAAILGFLCRRVKTRRTAQKNNPVDGSDTLQVEDSALKNNQSVNNGVNQEDTFKEEDISLLAKHADDHGINDRGSGRDHEDTAESEKIQNAEGGNGEHLNESFSCNMEGLILQLNYQPSNHIQILAEDNVEKRKKRSPNMIKHG